MSVPFPKTFISVFLFSFFTVSSFGQWQHIPAPEGGTINTIVKNGSSYFAAGYGTGVHRSDDNGESWSLVNNGIPSTAASNYLATINGVLFVQTGQSGKGLYRSTDNGQTWTQCNIDLVSHFLNDITSNGNTIYLAAKDGIHISVDNGVNWTYKPLDVVGYGVLSILYHNGKLIIGTDFLSVSEDEGDTWEVIDFPGRVPIAGIRELEVYNDKIFLTNSGKIWSTDASLQSFTQTAYFNGGTITSLKVFDNKLYATSPRYYAVTENDGVNWTLGRDPNNEVINDIEVVGSKFLIAGKRGIHASEDNGANWVLSNQGINALQIDAVSKDGNILTGYNRYTGVLKSNDGGESWYSANGDFPIERFPNGIDLIQSIGNVIVILTNREIWRSTNNGQTYTMNYAIENPALFGDKVYKNGTFLVVSKSNEILMSADTGATWTPIDLGTREIRSYFSSLDFEGQKIALQSDNQTILYSDDMGQTWTEKEKPLPTFITDLKIKDDNIFVMANYTIYKSSDFGDNWESKYGHLGIYTSRFHIVEDNVYVSGLSGISMASLNGDHFYNISGNMNGLRSGIFLNLNNELYAFSGSKGIWRRPLPTVPDDSDNDGVTDVDDNCPNTPENTFVNDQGCATAQLDDDNDGVFNNYDRCPNTPTGLSVNGTGCADSELDTDNDGVTNDIDQCPTYYDQVSVVNEVGCRIIPRNSLKVLTTSATCPGAANGMLQITADLNDIDYRITLIAPDNDESFFLYNNSQGPLSIDNLSSGTYRVHAEVLNSDFDYDFIVMVDELEPLNSGKRVLDLTKKSVTYEVSGSLMYSVQLNEVTQNFHFNDTDSHTISLEVSEGENKVVISAENDCQGKIEDQFTMKNALRFYPTITSDLINFQNLKEGAQLIIYSLGGTKVFESDLSDTDQVSIGHLNSGAYILHITMAEETTIHKIMKQ